MRECLEDGSGMDRRAQIGVERRPEPPFGRKKQWGGEGRWRPQTALGQVTGNASTSRGNRSSEIKGTGRWGGGRPRVPAHFIFETNLI